MHGDNLNDAYIFILINFTWYFPHSINLEILFLKHHLVQSSETANLP